MHLVFKPYNKPTYHIELFLLANDVKMDNLWQFLSRFGGGGGGGGGQGGQALLTAGSILAPKFQYIERTSMHFKSKKVSDCISE